MDIQQKERESLAAYIHRLKREANRCNFDNNAAMMDICIGTLECTHFGNTCLQKGTPTLVDAIREVEKLQSAQQLIATLMPSSTVNIILSEDEKCFQCQESGHMACHCPKVRCFDCDKCGHVAQTAQTRYHHQAHLHTMENTILA